jgi:hypothetical protein
MRNRPKLRIRLVDSHLECCIEARFLEIASTGRKRWKIGLQVSPLQCELTFTLDDYGRKESITPHITGGKMPSKERTALFAVR